ncbi:MAG: hypothetical protein ACJ78Q_07445 [Chloroflexia bacterium]
MEERERDKSGRLSPEIYVYATNKNFLNLYDALRIDKIKVEIAGYDPNTNRQTGHATAWIDVHDARLLSHLICQRTFAPVTGGRWEKYGGSQRDDGRLESRVLAVEWDQGEGGKFARFPYRISIANGPGKKTGTGGVSPDGPPTSQLSIRLPETDMIKVMLALGDYIHAYEAAHHHRIVADRVRELRDKLAGRPDRYEPMEAAPVAPRVERPGVPAPMPALQALPGGNRRASRPEAPQGGHERGRLTPLRSERAV